MSEGNGVPCPVDGCSSVLASQHGVATHVGRSHPSYKRQQIIDDIQSVAADTESPPLYDTYQEHGSFSHRSVYSHFDSWGDALQAAGFTPRVHRGATETDVLDAIRMLGAERGRAPSAPEFDADERIPYTFNVAINRFGSWNDAIREAGFEPNKEQSGDVGLNTSVTSETIIAEISRVASEIGHAPTKDEFDEHCDITAQCAQQRFDGWNNALRAAGYEATHIWSNESTTTRYGPNWDAQRAAVLDRDGMACRVCETHISSFEINAIHVHHITPARVFGAGDEAVETDYTEMNALENLIALCPSCHGQLEGSFQDESPDTFAELGKAQLGFDDGTQSDMTEAGDTVAVRPQATLDSF